MKGTILKNTAITESCFVSTHFCPRIDFHPSIKYSFSHRNIVNFPQFSHEKQRSNSHSCWNIFFKKVAIFDDLRGSCRPVFYTVSSFLHSWIFENAIRYQFLSNHWTVAVSCIARTISTHFIRFLHRLLHIFLIHQGFSIQRWKYKPCAWKTPLPYLFCLAHSEKES